jgi:hypothetical protein
VDPRRLIPAGLTLALVAIPLTARAQTPANNEDDVEVPAKPPSPAPAPAPAPTPAPAPAPPVVAASASEVAALRARLEALEARASREPSPPPPPAEPDDLRDGTSVLASSPWSRPWVRGLTLSGYVQGQYQSSQLSQDQLDANGNAINQDRFLVRRARLGAEWGTRYTAAAIEIDGNNVSGLAFGLRRAEASLVLRAADPDALPLLYIGVGLVGIPFGYELAERNRDRLFLERTTGSRAFFPGDADFGARVGGALGPFRYGIAVLNGRPLPDTQPSAAGVDPTSEKDLLARLGAEAKVVGSVTLSGGVSFVHGTGFHAGTQATKDSIQWRDLNGNGAVDPGEVTALPGHAATLSQAFDRWATGVDAQARWRTPLGWAMAYGEVYIGKNHDRGFYVADPITTGIDLREIGWYVGFLQEVTRWGVVGLRVDSYDPNLDATNQIAGSVLPLDQTVTTYSPLVGLVLPGHARLLFEYDHIVNRAGLDANGVPASLREDQWAVRLQVQQ